ncbi:MAG: hypothetical protein IT443_01615 [Phycisphaeraceae bacterium]|nr:hypothetical protein [Phycisphaeraceae bacterium]
MPSSPPLSPRARFAAALDRRPLPGRVPHFELVFFLTMEAFGKVHPSHRNYSQWMQMTPADRDLHRRDMARIYVDTADRYEQDAILLHPNPDYADLDQRVDEEIRLIDAVRDLSGNRYFLLLHGDPTFGIPTGSDMERRSLQMAEAPHELDAEGATRVDYCIRRAEKLAAHGRLDGFALCSDYCFNTGPFWPVPLFGRLITRHLKRVIAAYRALGFYTIKHTDGNIMPILDHLVAANPHALHSLDPQGGVDLAQVVKLVGHQVALCGNVDCGLLQTGSDEQCAAAVRSTLAQGLKAPGYIFGTSNCIYTGMELKRYDLMLHIWRKEGIRP